MKKKFDFSLSRHQVPAAPEGSEVWADWLRWLVMVMNPDDPQLGFIASLLHSALHYGKLTKRQAEAANRTIQRIQVAYFLDDLRCLKTTTQKGEVVGFRPRLAVDNTKEGA